MFCLKKYQDIGKRIIFKVILVVLRKKNIGSKCSNFYFRGSKKIKILYYIYIYIYILAKLRGSFESPGLWLVPPMPTLCFARFGI